MMAVTDILSSIDSALTSHEADVTGNPWPDRVPSLDEVVEVLFGPETGQPVPTYLGRAVLVPAQQRPEPQSDLARLYGPKVRVRPPGIRRILAEYRRAVERQARR